MTDRRSRRWFQLSLKSLFLLVLLVATFLAGYSLAARRAEAGHREAQEAVQLRLQAEKELAAARAELEKHVGWMRYQLVPPVDQ